MSRHSISLPQKENPEEKIGKRIACSRLKSGRLRVSYHHERALVFGSLNVAHLFVDL